MTPRSLRARLVLASVLWTSGLLLTLHMTSMLLLHLIPGLQRVRPWPALVAAFALMAAGVLVARGSLTPFRTLREKLNAIHQGQATQVDGHYPAELQPLVADLNTLLAAREQAVTRAQSTAANLAHGLKTPLAVLAQEADRAGPSELANSIHQQVDRMARQVEYQLARARAAASGANAAPIALAASVDDVLRTLRQLHADRALTLTSTVPAEFQVRLRREDLEELLGNLLDNACKWARANVAISATRASAGIILHVDDDGPGLPEAQREAVLERGVRWDESTPGTGLGLAIVRDLVEIYGGAVRLDASPLGGLRAALSLPDKADNMQVGSVGRT